MNWILESVLLTIRIDGGPMLVVFAAEDPRTKVLLLNHEDACRSYENLINLRRTSLVRNDETDVTAKTVRRARFPFQLPATLLSSYRQAIEQRGRAVHRESQRQGSQPPRWSVCEDRAGTQIECIPHLVGAPVSSRDYAGPRSDAWRTRAGYRRHTRWRTRGWTTRSKTPATRNQRADEQAVSWGFRRKE